MDDIVFKEKRNYRIKIEHGMQDEPLMGIEKLGVKISK
ncbi:MAG: gliding motility lipoprotein GldH [Prevotella sp.]|jgi:gliding motility-associated lipoprotein GldH|nr:gliding motility lipoprotein GldH [Prevotella sp.]